MKRLLLLALLLLSGCASSPLFVSDDGVSIYLQKKPVVKKDEYSIHFKFETPTDDSHVIQQIEMNGDQWTGIESFRVKSWGQTGTDHHHMSRTSVQHRRMTLMPGSVRGVDESNGFAMLPSGWPDQFNQNYRDGHKIQGEIIKMRPEHRTIYHLDFKDGKLVWYIEGESIRREWLAEDD
jgi:hypothetical protein